MIKGWIGTKLAILMLMLGTAAPAWSQSAAQPAKELSEARQAEQKLAWKKDKTVDAAIRSWPLSNLLARLSALSGWKIYVEPGLDEPISASFKNASQGDALKLLLGRINYALVPQGKGQSRLYVFSTNLGDGTRLIAPDAGAKPENWLANEIILTVAPDSETDIEALAKELGATITASSDALNAYRLEFPDAESAQAAREKLASREGLDAQDNYAFERPEITSGGGQSPAAMFPLDTSPVASGEQVTVALVDTPIQPLGGKMDDFVLPSLHVRDEPGSLPAEPTHATSMAQTMLNSMAFVGEAAEQSGNPLGKVRVLPIDIYGSNGTTTTFEVAQGLYAAIQSGAHVVNLSLGGTGDSPMVEYLLDSARQKNILVFASAGNSPTTYPTWPAASPNAIAVTAADWNGNIASYANRGDFVDLKAPGTSKVYYNGQAYISTGTSTATAFVSGQAAALSAAGLTPAQVAEFMQRNFDVNAPPLERVPRR